MAVANTFTSMMPMFKESYANGKNTTDGGSAYAAKRMKEVGFEKPKRKYKFSKLTETIRRKNGTR